MPYATQEKEGLTTEWVLRVSVFGEFLGFGVLALLGRQDWAGWIHTLLGVSLGVADQLLVLIGLFDIIVAMFVLIRPVRAVILAAAIWGFLTAVVQPFVGVPFWDLVGHAVNWLTPLALFLVRGLPKKPADWLA